MSSAVVPRSGAVAEGGCPPGRGCGVQAWLVTAPQQQPRPFSGGRAPWGTYHLKENGGHLTACGEYAVGWHVFWDHQITPLAPQACRACLDVFRELGADVRRSQGPNQRSNRAATPV